VVCARLSVKAANTSRTSPFASQECQLSVSYGSVWPLALLLSLFVHLPDKQTNKQTNKRAIPVWTWSHANSPLLAICHAHLTQKIVGSMLKKRKYKNYAKHKNPKMKSSSGFWDDVGECGDKIALVHKLER